MTIHDVKNDPILQVSSQQPSTSSKYGIWGCGILDTLLIMLQSLNLLHKSRIAYQDDPCCKKSHIMVIHDVMNDHILEDSSQESSMSSKYIGSRMEGSWHTCNHDREQKIVTEVKNHISWRSMMSRMTPSSKYPLRNHQHPQSMNFLEGGCLTQF